MVAKTSLFPVEQAALLLSLPQLDSAPSDPRPELCVVGRSNVGKSSLLNLLLARSGLARTSRTPGRTRLFNFFDAKVRGPQRHLLDLRVVDLPGYGYAKVSHAERGRLNRMLEDYFVRAQRATAALLLIDARHEVPEIDQHMHAVLLQSGVPFVIAATKTDRVPKARRVGVRRRLEKALVGGEVVLTSASEKLGRDLLWRALWSLLVGAPGEEES
ncbi:MAG: ribosome biogenesis GTP-binding protein YihA/YsxC [Pseudomonadota bacterium]